MVFVMEASEGESRGRGAAGLVVRLLGPFEARVGGDPLRLRGRSGKWLLALLALRAGREVDRGWLAGLLWPDSEGDLAKGNLRRTLTDLRTALGPEAGRITAPTPQLLRLEPIGADIDVVAFDRALATGGPLAWAEAADRYGGPLLPDCAEPWVRPDRESRRQGVLRALDALADGAQKAGDLKGAEGWLRRAAAASPSREATHRALMRTLAARGDFAEVTRVFRDLKSALRAELNADPSPETERLFRALREGASDPAVPPVAEAGPPAVPMPAQLPVGPAVPAWAQPMTTLIGREAELATLVDCVGAARLVTLTGCGGIGKTRLGLATIAGMGGALGGVVHVSLAGVASATQLPGAIALAAGLEAAGALPELAVDLHFGEGRWLLFLDNCEHLVEPVAELALRLLRAAPGLRILATSRGPLDCPGETVWRVAPLPLPEAASSLRESLESPAVRLLLERARAVDPAFELTESMAADAVRLCRAVDGLPLAIELAAARLRTIGLREAASHLDQRLEWLSGGRRQVPERHRTMRATLDWSWDLLEPDARALLQRLSVFAGRFDLGLAGEVSPGGSTLAIIDALGVLVDQSVLALERDPGGDVLYHLLGIVREYALERLAESGAEADARWSHARAMLRRAEQAAGELQGAAGPVWLARLDAAHDEMRAALAWLVSPESGDPGADASLRLAGALWRFWRLRSYFTEGRQWLDASLARAGAAAPHLLEEPLHGAGTLAWLAGDLDTALRRHGQCLIVRRQLGRGLPIAWSLTNLGIVAMYLGKLDEATALHGEALSLFEAASDSLGRSAAEMNLGVLACYRGDYEAAMTWHLGALGEARERRSVETVTRALLNVAYVAWRARPLEEARSWLLEALDGLVSVGDRHGVAFLLDTCARMAGQLGDWRTVLVVLGAAETTRALVGGPRPPADVAEFTALADQARRELGAVEGTEAWGTGASLRLPDAVELARRFLS